MQLVSGRFVPALARKGLTELMASMSASPGGNLAIFTGDEIIVHRGCAEMTSILPRGVAKHVKQIHRTPIYNRMLEALRVEFNNGKHATLFMNLGMVDPVDDEDLKEFRATCLMIHDL